MVGILAYITQHNQRMSAVWIIRSNREGKVMRVITNNVPRFLIGRADLSESEREEFSYFTWEQLEDMEFFRYKGQVYNLADFMATPSKSEVPAFEGWAGYSPDSAFSGILIRWPDTEYDSVVVAHYIS